MNQSMNQDPKEGPQEDNSQRPREELFLPDFCEIQMVFATLVVGELLALVLALNPADQSQSGWQNLALISLFIQWVALGSIASLCLLRRVLERFGNITAALVSYLVIVLITIAVSEIVYRYFLPQTQLGDLQFNWLFESGVSGLGDPQAVIPNLPSHLDFLLRNLAIGAIVGALALRYFYVRYQWQVRMELETHARIQALQSRIRPHFLFNSMNTIASLTRSAPALAEQVTEDLADLFRVSLADARVATRLGQEFELCQQYLRIEGHRLGERLKTEFQLEGVPLDARLPGLILQPLLENAIYHGIEPSAAGGQVRVVGRLEDHTICLDISNSLPLDRRQATRSGNRMALDNIRMRLEVFFERQASVETSEEADSYHVRMRFPYRSDESSGEGTAR